MWIRIGDDYFNTDNLACIRPVDDGDDQTILFTSGQSAVDGGFLVDVPTEEVFEAVQNARLLELSQMIETNGITNEITTDESPDDER